MVRLGLYDTLTSLVLVYTSFTLPFCILMLRAYFIEVPRELEEAAMVDGCSRLGAVVRVLLPLSGPALVGSGLYTFLLAWNEFLFAVVLTSGSGAAPLTVRMSQFFSQYGRDWNSIMALNVIALLPLLAIFIWLQRWVITGMTAGAVR